MSDPPTTPDARVTETLTRIRATRTTRRVPFVRRVIALGWVRLAAVATIVAFWNRMLPPRNDADVVMRAELAVAIVDVTDSWWERMQLAKIARYESNLRRDVADCVRRGPEGEVTAWQILPRSGTERQALCVSYEGDAAIALERIHESLRACSREPEADRLALYARGSCSSVEGKRLSRTRWVARGGNIR